MNEITATTQPRTFIPRSGNRFFISHSDFLMLMCQDCGGCKMIVMHTRPGQIEWTPAVKQCKCEGKNE